MTPKGRKNKQAKKTPGAEKVSRPAAGAERRSMRSYIANRRMTGGY